MGKSMSLDTDGTNIEKLIEDHTKELTMEELPELQSEQQEVLVEEHPLRKRKTGRLAAM